MAATTVDRDTPALLTWRQNTQLLANPSVVPAGVMAAVDSTGKVPTGGSSDTAGLVVVGRSEHAASYAAGDRDLVTSRGVFAFVASVALAALGNAMRGRKVYVVNNQTVGLASDTVNMVVAGILEEVEGDNYYVALGLGEEYSGSIDGGDLATLANAAVSPVELTLGAGGLIAIDIPDAAGDTTYVFKTAAKIEIVAAWNIKDGAGAANTIQVTDGADAAITNAMAAAVDKTSTYATTIDKAKRVLNAGATFKVVAHRAAGTMAAQLFIHAIKRA